MSQSTMRLQSFDLASQDIASVDVEWLHGLSLGVEWPHRAADWDFLREVGHGFVALDEIGRIFSSAMWFPCGADCATIGMVITSPRVQTHGGGRWMMEVILRQCGERRLILNATRAAYSLYLSLGFVPQATVYQCQGYARPVMPGDAGAVETIPATGIPEVAALDAAAFGADRSALMARLAGVAEIRGLRRGGRLAAYAMRRPFGRGIVIGPVVAESEDEAVQLVAALLDGLDGQFVRVDTRQAGGVLRTFLHAAGLTLHDTVTTMTRGAPLPKVEPGAPGTYALAAHALS
ncbi:GNAT family N-acetyltransferase [Methylobacterium platani]|uniref:GNAT family acetyltransferase n=2 Tax=Methylobacterium platani TaxID=427683 RepID=A0A179SGZ0_9HYPH|nr:GNAT family N-acetyltransferase [Methylobacterium platani]KMO20175.1 GNAT family acetyltransferase [Methylobacterium platani JCM 14648]OAS25727.1 GNAT family acetyltransferase [Methylobacterium platani]